MDNWQCPNCGEQHSAKFRLCWNCGSDPQGTINPEFKSLKQSSQADEQESRPASDPDELPPLNLPTITYFSIPLFLICSVILLASHPKKLQGQADFRTFLPQSTGEIVFIVLSILLITIPCFWTLIRGIFVRITRKQSSSPTTQTLLDSVQEVKWILSMFGLPKGLHKSCPWFVPVYYGAMIVYVVAIPSILLWQAINDFR